MDDQWYAEGPDSDNPPVNQIEQMIWALVDGQLTESEVEAFEKVLSEDDAARQTYVECMALHADLHDFFRQCQAGGSKPELASTPLAPSEIVAAVASRR